MKKFLDFIFRYTNIFGLVFLFGFIVLYIFFNKRIIDAFSIAFKLKTTNLYYLLIVAFIGLAFSEYFSALLAKPIKSIFPTNKLPKWLKKIHDKFLNLGVVFFFLAIGIDPLLILLDINISAEITFKKDFYVLSLLIFILYSVSVSLLSAFFYYKDEFKEIKNKYLMSLNKD